MRLANTWIIVTEGGSGTPDKPDVVLAVPSDLSRFDAFLNIRVAEFITPPLDNHGYEKRCYVRDPDGRIIEVGQHTGMLAVFGIESD